ncbi:MAG: hypothetical protein OEW75_05800 [Cyclobacteriaceae bacterium]|nr:hypothetical protein [Cyclobacteriaceae bacterium]
MKKDEAILEYSRAFVSKLIEESGSKEKYTGNDIKNFSTLNYLNLIILKNLLIEWKIELKKMESPYFDFQQKEVQEQFKKFANVLSRNILVDHNTFKSLAEKSVYESLLLVSSPYEYFNEMIKEEKMKLISLADFKQLFKYIKINTHVLEYFLKCLENNKRESVYGANDILEEVFENLEKQPADPKPYIEEFSSILPLSENTLYGDYGKETHKKQEPTKFEDLEKVIASTDFATLNEKFQAPVQKSIVDIHQKIEDIRKSLTLNQRIMFVNYLFEGNETQFNEIVTHLESMSSFSEAKSFIKTKFIWDESSEEVQEFLEILERRLR